MYLSETKVKYIIMDGVHLYYSDSIIPSLCETEGSTSGGWKSRTIFIIMKSLHTNQYICFYFHKK